MIHQIKQSTTYITQMGIIIKIYKKRGKRCKVQFNPVDYKIYLLTIKPSPQSELGLYAMGLSFCLLMLIMLNVRSFVCRQRVLVGQWPEWPSTAIVLAVVSDRSAAVPPGEKLHPPPA